MQSGGLIATGGMSGIINIHDPLQLTRDSPAQSYKLVRVKTEAADPIYRKIPVGMQPEKQRVCCS